MTSEKPEMTLKGALTTVIGLMLVGVLVGLAIRFHVLDGRTHERFLTRVKSWGVQVVVQVPPGRKLVGASWKGDGLWVLTRPTAPGEISNQVWEMDEYSGWGLFGGHVELREAAVPAE